MIPFKHCGKTYPAGIGDSIRCDVCGRTFTITRDASTLSRQPPPTAVPPQPKSPWVPAPPLKSRRFLTRNILLPAFGILALAAGVTLTVFNYRSRTNASLVAQTSASQTPSPPTNPSASVATHPTPTLTLKSTSPTPQPTSTRVANNGSTSPFEFFPDPTPAPTAPPETIRYPTGTNLMRPLSANGRGALHISNGTGFDAIAKLVDVGTNLTVRLVYIQANTDGEITSISSGDYSVKFALGTGYNRDSGHFLYGQSFAKFDETFDFHQYRTSEGVEWTDYNISLHGVVGGTARTSRISASEFYDR